MQEQLISGWKVCGECGVEQPIDEFQLHRGKHARVCRPCLAVAAGRTPDPISHKARAALRAQGFKVCCGCGATRKVTEFYRSTASDGLNSRCKDCVRTRARARYHTHNGRENRLRRMYGVEAEDVEAMMAAQKNACAICRGQFAETRWERACVDHCHKTGAIRGLLCFWCNTGLGKFKDDSAALRAAADYLDKANGRAEP